MGAAPCRLGVPEPCGFLWEEAARGPSARLVALEAQEGEIPLPPSGSLILPLPQGPGLRDLLPRPPIFSGYPNLTLIPFREIDLSPSLLFSTSLNHVFISLAPGFQTPSRARSGPLCLHSMKST